MSTLKDTEALPAYARWVELCRELNEDAAASRLFRERRYAFNHRLASCLVENLPAKGLDQVIYAVHLVGCHPRPAYLGTSLEGRRRLWDLPVGESHHLSNTYPPEIWERVQVLHWRQIFELNRIDLAALEAGVAELFPAKPAESLKLIGMGIEFLFQKETMPELNVRIKLRAGGFREIRAEASKSRQALIASRWLEPLFPVLMDSWKQLGTAAVGDSGQALHTPTGSVIFPARILRDMTGLT